MTSAAGDLNRSLDMYVVFAFAAADLLIEVNESGAVTFTVGAAMALMGIPARRMAGIKLTDLFITSDEARVARALARIDAGERIRNMMLRIKASDEASQDEGQWVSLSGYAHPHQPGSRLLALAHATGTMIPTQKHDSPSGLLDQNRFADLARRMIPESTGTRESDAYRLTVLDVPQVKTVRAKSGPVAADEFIAELGERLRSMSLGGDAAGDLGENRFGVIHAPGISDKTIGDLIDDLVHDFLPKAAPIRSATMALDVGGISAEEATNAILYTLNRFSASSAVDLTALANEVRPRLSETVSQMREIKDVIDSGGFELVFQPIVDLWTDVVHHFECLVRFPGKDSPFETVTFAENVGIVGGLDLAIVTRAVAFMRSPVGNHESLRFAVNLSGRSLSHTATARRLLDMAEKARDLKGRLLFELTESAAVTDLPAVNGVLQTLRQWGFAVCLDDFGAGSAAFHYLRALQVDHVKIDGSYIHNITRNENNMPFLRAITQLCGELKVGTIAEYVENSETANLLKLLRVRFGQGYLYGKPMRPTENINAPMQGWIGTGLSWQNGLLVFQPSMNNSVTPSGRTR